MTMSLSLSAKPVLWCTPHHLQRHAHHLTSSQADRAWAPTPKARSSPSKRTHKQTNRNRTLRLQAAQASHPAQRHPPSPKNNAPRNFKPRKPEQRKELPANTRQTHSEAQTQGPRHSTLLSSRHAAHTPSRLGAGLLLDYNPFSAEKLTAPATVFVAAAALSAVFLVSEPTRRRKA